MLKIIFEEKQEIARINKTHLKKKERAKLLNKCQQKYDMKKEMIAIPYKYGIVGVVVDDDEFDY